MVPTKTHIGQQKINKIGRFLQCVRLILLINNSFIAPETHFTNPAGTVDFSTIKTSPSLTPMVT